MNSGFCYYVHGFTLHSEIECPELLPSRGGAPDVRVRIGSLDPVPPDESHPGRIRRVGERHMLLDIEGVGRFSVRDGREVVVDPGPGAEAGTLRHFLFGSVFGCLIHQRHLLPLHANAFLHGGEAVLVLAHSGTGKSTLAAAMKNRGCKILADDVCAVKATERESVVFPGVPQIKLRRDAAERLGADVRGLRRIVDGGEKYAMPVLEPYCGQAVRIKAMYILNASEGGGPRIVEPGRFEKIEALRNYTYRKGMVAKLGIETAHLKSCAALEQSVPMRRICRPKKPFLLDELVALIETDLR